MPADSGGCAPYSKSWCAMQPNVEYGAVDRIVRGILAEELHHFHVMSLAFVVSGTVRADRRGVATVDRTIATGRGKDPKARRQAGRPVPVEQEAVDGEGVASADADAGRPARAEPDQDGPDRSARAVIR